MGFLIVSGAVVLLTLLARALIFHFIPPLLARHSPLWAEILTEHNVLHYLYLAVPGLLVAFIAQLTPDYFSGLATIIYKGAILYCVVMIMMSLISTLYAYNDFYDQKYEFAKQVPIKTLIQSAVALIIVFAVLIMIAVLLGVPLLAMAGIIAGLGAVAYYLFREPLLGFTASLQLSVNRMLGIGDWMEMAQYGVDGEVIDINLTSTKVRNWDNAIVNVPTADLIRNPFRNWQSMQSEAARRVLRPIYVDQETIAFVTKEQKGALLGKISHLYENLGAAMRENDGLQGITPAGLEARDDLTNVELFMAYATLVIAGHPQTRADYNLFVRQQDPGQQGLPLELLFFTRATDFVPYYAVQRKIFSHLLAALPQFALRPYQVMHD